MIEIDSSTIVSSITRALKNKYQDVNIYKDKKLQGLVKPCFFVFQLNIEQRKISKEIYSRDILINVRYHSDLKRCEIDKVAFDLLDLFREIKTEEGLILRPKKEIKYEVSDDVLQIFIPYKVNVIRNEENGVTMNKLESKGVEI
ncbi:phage tail terminator family protein [Clostridium chrysemydis]|uniref:phage tail terminator family protein n=1 Tax=Clostridium chrysemydis TaxID=2665504 RepID=UPI003F2DECB1